MNYPTDDDVEFADVTDDSGLVGIDRATNEWWKSYEAVAKLEAVRKFAEWISRIHADPLASVPDPCAPQQPAPPKKRATHECPGCKRRLPDNIPYCGRPKCWEALHWLQVKHTTPQQTNDAIDAMHRQRGCSPFSLGWKHRP